MLCLTLLPIHTRPANRRFSFIGVLSSARCPFRCRRPSAPSRRSRLRAVGRVSVPLPAPTGAGNGTDCTHCRSSLCVLQCLRDLLSGSLSLCLSLSLSRSLFGDPCRLVLSSPHSLYSVLSQLPRAAGRRSTFYFLNK